MNDFLRRNMGVMTPPEFARYCELLIYDPLLLSYAEALSNRFEVDVQIEVDKKLSEAVEEDIAEKIRERLEVVADDVDELEEGVLAALKYLPYDELVDRVEELFEKFHEEQPLRGG